MSKPRSFGARHLIGAAVTLLCLVVIARQINLDEVLQALKEFKWPYLAFGIASLSVGYALRIFRWSILLQASGAVTPWRSCSAPFLGSIALNNVLPLRIGDVVRALVFPAALGISRTTATSRLIIERLIDLLTLLGCLLLGIVATQLRGHVAAARMAGGGRHIDAGMGGRSRGVLFHAARLRPGREPGAGGGGDGHCYPGDSGAFGARLYRPVPFGGLHRHHDAGRHVGPGWQLRHSFSSRPVAANYDCGGDRHLGDPHPVPWHSNRIQQNLKSSDP